MEASAWAVPGAVAVIGGILGWILTTRLGGDTDPSVGAQGARNDHEAEKAEVLAALRALEAEKDKLDPSAYANEREALLARGEAAMKALEGLNEPAPALSAAVLALLRTERGRLGDAAVRRLLLAELDAATGTAKAAAPAVKAPGPPPLVAPEWRGALYTAGAFAAVLGIIYFIGGETGQRIGDGPMTGRGGGAQGEQAQQAQQAPRPDPEMQAQKARFRAQLDTNPNDIEALNGLTELAFGEMDLASAMQYNQRAITAVPEDPDARANKAMLAARVGMMDSAFEQLDAILAQHPDHEKALLYKGLLALRTGRADLAVPALERLTAGVRGQDPFLQEQLAAARAALAGGAPSPAGSPPGPALPQGAPVIEGVISLGEGAQAGDARTLYVALRDPAGGPPLAAKKLTVTTWPMPFTILPSDAIAMGGAPRPFPAQLVVTARLDPDGDPMTKEPGAPEARLEGVPVGSTGLTISLR